MGVVGTNRNAMMLGSNTTGRLLYRNLVRLCVLVCRQMCVVFVCLNVCAILLGSNTTGRLLYRNLVRLCVCVFVCLCVV